MKDVESREADGRFADERCACFVPGLPTRGTLALTSAAAESASQKVLVRIALDWRRWLEKRTRKLEGARHGCGVRLYPRALANSNHGRVRTVRSQGVRRL